MPRRGSIARLMAAVALIGLGPGCCSWLGDGDDWRFGELGADGGPRPRRPVRGARWRPAGSRRFSCRAGTWRSLPRSGSGAVWVGPLLASDRYCPSRPGRSIPTRRSAWPRQPIWPGDRSDLGRAILALWIMDGVRDPAGLRCRHPESCDSGRWQVAGPGSSLRSGRLAVAAIRRLARPADACPTPSPHRPDRGPPDRSMSQPRTDSTAALADLDALQAEGEAAFRGRRLGRRRRGGPDRVPRPEAGRLKAAQERLKTLEPAAKKAYGQRFNAAKQAIEAAFEAAKSRVERPGDGGRCDRRHLARASGPGSGIGTPDPDGRRADRPVRPVRVRRWRGGRRSRTSGTTSRR